MTDTPSERRLAENEVVFRQLNQQVSEGFKETNRLAMEDDQPEFRMDLKDEDDTLKFFCECADETCAQRISLSFRDYAEIHRSNNNFIIIPGHEVTSIEKIVKKTPDYYIVEKLSEPPTQAEGLNPTSISNS